MADEIIWVSPSTLKPDKVTKLNGVTINKFFLKDHNVNNIALPTKRTNKFKGVVIHNTPRANSADDGRQYSGATLNDNVETRTHYYISELSAWQNLDLSDMNWSCGDGTKGEGNNGCISLEIIMSSTTGDKNIKARDNGARLAAYLLYKANMTVDNMYTHNYFLNIRNGVKGDYAFLCTSPTPTRNCPAYIVGDWEGFRRQVDSYIKTLGGKSIYNDEVDPDSSHEDVQLIYQAVSTAAIRADMSKSAKIYGRVTKGDYYPVDRKYTVNGEVWLRHAGQEAYSMLNDGGALFRRVAAYSTKRTTCMVNIRDKASLKGNKVDTLPAQTIVYMWAGDPPVLVDGYHWAKIVYEGKICYIASEYLK